MWHYFASDLTYFAHMLPYILAVSFVTNHLIALSIDHHASVTNLVLISAPLLQANDFGSEVIPGAKDLGMHVQAYLYDGYWEDIGTIEAFYQANLALTKNPKPDYRCPHHFSCLG